MIFQKLGRPLSLQVHISASSKPNRWIRTLSVKRIFTETEPCGKNVFEVSLLRIKEWNNFVVIFSRLLQAKPSPLQSGSVFSTISQRVSQNVSSTIPTILAVLWCESAMSRSTCGSEVRHNGSKITRALMDTTLPWPHRRQQILPPPTH